MNGWCMDIDSRIWMHYCSSLTLYFSAPWHISLPISNLALLEILLHGNSTVNIQPCQRAIVFLFRRILWETHMISSVITTLFLQKFGLLPDRPICFYKSTPGPLGLPIDTNDLYTVTNECDPGFADHSSLMTK